MFRTDQTSAAIIANLQNFCLPIFQPVLKDDLSFEKG